MTYEAEDVATSILESFCGELRAETLSDGAVALVTPFLFADGDGLVAVLERRGADGWRLTDRGASVAHFFNDEVELSEGRTSRLADIANANRCVLSEQLEISVVFDEQPDAFDLADYLRVVSEIGAVAHWSNERTRTSYSRHVIDAIESWSDVQSVEPGWHPSEDSRRLYEADLKVEGTELPLVVFAVGNAAAAGRAALSIGKYREWDLDVQPLVACRPKSVPSGDVYRLQEVANDDNVFTVESGSYRRLNRELRERGALIRQLD